MPSAVAQRAFEPLFTTKAASAGTGLGLAQVMAMCEQAGGTARIVSAEGEGTTVSLFLPRGLREADAKGTVTPAHTPAISESIKGSVLLVEDNEEVAAGLSAVLEVFG